MNEHKKILYLRTDIYDGKLIAGGSVSHTLGVIQGFLQLGYSIVYASSLTIPSVEQLELIEKVTLKNPRMIHWMRWKLNCVLSNIFFTYQALSLCRAHTFLFIYQRYSLLNCTGVLVRMFTKIPLILEYNGSEVWVNKHWAQEKKFKLAWLSQAIEITNLKKADRIIVVSQALKDELKDRGIDVTKVVVNPNGVDTEIYDPAYLEPVRTKIRKDLTIESKVVFGFIGTFSAWHGIEVLAQIIPSIIHRKPQAHFLLIGDGPLKAFLINELEQHNIAHHVHFLGMLPPTQARNYLAACDVYLSPTQPNPDGSRFFGSPTKLFEYMSMAKPIIASDIEQLADIIKPAVRTHDEIHTESIGFLVSPQDIDGFVTVATNVIDTDPQLLHHMGTRSRNKAVANYTWRTHVENIVRACEQWEGL